VAQSSTNVTSTPTPLATTRPLPQGGILRGANNSGLRTVEGVALQHCDIPDSGNPGASGHRLAAATQSSTPD